MGVQCCDESEYEPQSAQDDLRYGRVLWFALIVNGGMFFIEIAMGLTFGSVSLQADALDFLGDAGNYAVSLFVLSMSLKIRARAAFFKGVIMGLFGLWVIASVFFHVILGTFPDARAMGLVGTLALIANTSVFILLWNHRGGDSNRRSVWLCTRNDVISNIAVLLAAVGVFGSGSGWPDVFVGAIMACLALQGSWVVIRRSRIEIGQDKNKKITIAMN
ncbi:MAG: cation transporter [Sneathiella sp.]|uniref:cation transporter n=1 Tax=Sneathiella sp. TaxID=1964365 RepID=UPI003002A46A